MECNIAAALSPLRDECAQGVAELQFRCGPVPPLLPPQTCKFKGLVNDDIQIKASFSDDGKYVISGSEDGQVTTDHLPQRTCIAT